VVKLRALRESKHQRDELAAAVDFKLAEDRMEVLFHHRQTQAGAISNLLVAPPAAAAFSLDSSSTFSSPVANSPRAEGWRFSLDQAQGHY